MLCPVDMFHHILLLPGCKLLNRFSFAMDFLMPDGASEEIDFYKLNANDNASYISSSSDYDDESENGKADEKELEMLDKDYGVGSVVSEDKTDDTSSISGASHNSLSYGFIPKGCYTHPIKSGAILGGKLA